MTTTTTTLPDQIELCSFPFQDEGKWHNATVFCFNNTSIPNTDVCTTSYKDGRITSILHEELGAEDTYTIYQYEDHYDISKEEADEYCDEHEQRIREYAEFVYETGTDPLNNYPSVERTETKKSEVKVQYGLYIGVEKRGVQVTQIEFEGVTYGRLELNKLPSKVKDYLHIEYAYCRYYLDNIQRKDLYDYDTCYDVTDNSFKCMIEYEVERPSDVIAEELRAIAL